MPNVSIRARLIFLSILLLATLAVSSALLIRELARELAEPRRGGVARLRGPERQFGQQALRRFEVLGDRLGGLAARALATSRRRRQGAARLRPDGDFRSRSCGRRRHRRRSRHHDRIGASGGRGLLGRRQRRRQRAAGAGKKPHSQYRRPDRQDRRPGRAAGRGPARRFDAPGGTRGQACDRRRIRRAGARVGLDRADRALDHRPAEAVGAKHGGHHPRRTRGRVAAGGRRRDRGDDEDARHVA